MSQPHDDPTQAALRTWTFFTTHNDQKIVLAKFESTSPIIVQDSRDPNKVAVLSAPQPGNAYGPLQDTEGHWHTLSALKVAHVEVVRHAIQPVG